LRVEFQLVHTVADPLEIAWEYWDGQIWRGFAARDINCELQPDDDSTKGLTVSGVVKLKADCAKSDKTMVNGVTNYWIRGRLTQPLPPDPAKPLSEVESVRISSVVSQPMVGRLSGKANPFIPDGEIIGVPPLTGVLLTDAGGPLVNATVVISDPKIPSF